MVALNNGPPSGPVVVTLFGYKFNMWHCLRGVPQSVGTYRTQELFSKNASTIVENGTSQVVLVVFIHFSLKDAWAGYLSDSQAVLKN